MNIDWSKAPEDSTHAGNSPYEKGVVTWFKGISDPASRNYFMNEGSMNAWAISSENLSAWDLIERPKKQEAWDGEGLPPVGLDVEIKRGNCTWIDGDEWQIGKTATVMASFLNSRDIEMASVQFPGGHCECILARCLSPIRTAEQLAEEEREKEAIELYLTMQPASNSKAWDNIGGCARDRYRLAISSGYRKQ